MRLRWVSAVALLVRRLVYPPRCRICGVLLSWEAPVGLQSPGEADLAGLFHGALCGVMCAACRSGVQEPSGQRCSACGEPLPGVVAEPLLCGACMDPDRALTRMTALYLYDGGPALAVQALKYKNKRALAPPMGRLLFVRALGAYLDGDSKRWDIDLVVPVPLHGKRLRKRGFNQSSLLVAPFEGRDGIRVCHRLLRRSRPTASQAGLSRRARLSNVKGAFELAFGASPRGKRVLLVDDVYTTGSTLTACAALLKKHGAAEVSALVFARRDMTR
ncbi:ComF family protein [Desulfoluna butyratoxydans]|uniref:Phosphoribosyltransferase-like n=1 Tax=Desulfoluna butyratoxydans TaxID=231438 RepID=A0A4U8YHE8_9BACT|nr:ComF family protein [Desulfoluna butyratoxydans]VFQ42584.1 phosphoribosyltransferase-like [Desulfoluna butyratoxydans]